MGDVDDGDVEQGVKSQWGILGRVGVGGEGGHEPEVLQGGEGLFLDLLDVVFVGETDDSRDFIEGADRVPLRRVVAGS